MKGEIYMNQLINAFKELFGIIAEYDANIGLISKLIDWATKYHTSFILAMFVMLFATLIVYFLIRFYLIAPIVGFWKAIMETRDDHYADKCKKFLQGRKCKKKNNSKTPKQNPNRKGAKDKRRAKEKAKRNSS
jgi:hypothetical protein